MPTKAVSPPDIDTRMSISRAATQLFAEHGYAGTSIRDIVEAAGVTKPVLYYYFKNKEDLYRTILNDIYGYWTPNLQACIDQNADFHTRLRKVVDFMFKCEDEHEEHAIRLVYSAAFGPRAQARVVDILELEREHFALLERFFQEGIDSGLIRPASAQAAAYHFFGAVIMYLNLRLVADLEITESIKEQVIDFTMNGIAS